jgi:hypothetical protein
MTRLVLAAAALAALVLPSVSLAKGPTEGSISGPGFAKTFKVTGDGGGGTPTGDLTQASGFFPAAYGQSPDPMWHRRPTGTLGPRYALVWKVPDGEGRVFVIRQDLYPYAASGAVTYMKPGQSIFGMSTHGGWYRDSALKRTVVALGLPARAPSSGSGFNYPLVLGLVAAGLLAAALLAFFWRQRGQRSPATSSTELPAGSRT